MIITDIFAVNFYVLTQKQGNIYFISDVHLGAPALKNNKEREMLFVRWLDEIKKDAQALFLMGDIFDFWFEYKKVVPKGYVRLLGKLAELADAGIEIKYFIGNHDMWQQNYFEDEIGLKIYRHPIVENINGKTFYIGHGDGLGNGDYGYKFLKLLFRSPICQFLFRQIPPRIGLLLGSYWSGQSRYLNRNRVNIFKGNDKEYLIKYSKQYLKSNHIDYFVFGHRHLSLEIDLGNNSKYINVGEWMDKKSYAVLIGDALHLKYFKPSSR